jgi:methylated-DNA-[protein]-cysteine S-methyltransferase
MTSYKSYYESPLGRILCATDGNAVTGLWFEGQRYFPKDTDSWEESSDHPVLRRLCSWLNAYFEGKNPRIDFSLAPQGTAFQREVWSILQEIPYGRTTTYGEIAKRIGRERGQARQTAPRAVGGAVGQNPISLVIPCHRVIGSNKSLTGYAGGLHRKAALLQLERIL